MWVQQQFHTSYDLAFLSSQSGNTVDFARSQLEWMTDKCQKMFDTHKMNPFTFQHLKLLTSLDEVSNLRQPFVLFASNPTLETSLAQDVFCKIAIERKNLLLLTQRAPSWSLAGTFFDPTKPNSLRSEMPREVRFIRRRRIKLEGLELEQFQKEQKIERYVMAEIDTHTRTRTRATNHSNSAIFLCLLSGLVCA